MIGAMARYAGGQVADLWRTTFARIGNLFWENPKYLVLFGIRLLAASALTDRGGRGHTPGTLAISVGQTAVKSFFRGLIPVIAIGIAGGVAVGSLAGSLGPLIRPVVENPVMRLLLADILPLLLALLLAARNGSAIAARLALLQPPGTPPRLTRNMVLGEGLPSLIAAPFIGVVFYAVLAACLVAGYLVGSSRPIEVVLSLDGAVIFLRDYFSALATTVDYVRVRQVWEVVRDGALKSILFGAVVAFIAVAFGVRSAERKLSDTAEYFDFNNAVWESTVTALTICGILTFLLWTNL